MMSSFGFFNLLRMIALDYCHQALISKATHSREHSGFRMKILVFVLLFQALPQLRSQILPPIGDNNDLWALVGGI